MGVALAKLPLPMRCAHASGQEKRLRVAAIGVGNRGFDNLLALGAEQQAIVAICDVDARYLEAAARQFPNARTYQDYRQLLKDEELDAVVISTPDHSHALPALLGLRRGCHTYCEKPLAHNLHETRLLVSAARQSGVITQMANQHRSSDGYRLARHWLETEVLGQVHSVHAWTVRPLWPQGITRPTEPMQVPEYLNWDFWLGPAPERPYHSAYHPIAWRGWWDFGTGALGDLGTHLLDPVLSGLHLQLPSHVESESGEAHPDSFPAASIIRFQFTSKSDRPIELIWYDGGKQPSKEMTGADRLPDEGALVIGERGKLFIPTLGKTPRLLPPSLAQDAPPLPETEVYASHIGQWITACLRNEPGICDTSFENGARLTDVCLLGNLALRVGDGIEWDSARHAPVACPECEPYLARQPRAGWELM